MSVSLPGQRAGALRTDRQLMANYAGMVCERGVIDATNSYDGGNTDYERELRVGQVMARITSSKKWVPCKRSQTNGAGDAATALIVDDVRAFKAGETLTIGGNQVFSLGRVKDNDNAASTGVAVYLHVDELSESPFGHLECVNAGNADSSFTIGVSGAVVKVEDDDAAATGGFQVYFDEDATNPDERFLAAVPTTKDAFILASDGRAIRIKYHATPSSVGVAVYFDDDGATASERLLFVSPTNAEGRYHTDDTVNTSVPTAYVTRTTGATISSINYSTNTITLSASASWADGDAVYCDSLAGSEIPRALLNEFVDLIDDDAVARDKQTGKLVIGGYVYSGTVLGDLAAMRASTTTGYLSQISWDDEQGAT
jgi:hypothetical protein